MKTLKQFVLCIFLLMTTANIFAQQANRLRGNINVGAVIPAVGDLSLNFDGNLGWNIWADLLVGVRYGLVFDPGNPIRPATITNQHILATSTYFFNPRQSVFALFGGIGAGAYATSSIFDGILYAERGTVLGLGCMLTVGFEAGRFRVAFEYHLVANSKIFAGGILGGYRNNNFLTIAIGFTICGGSLHHQQRQARQQRTPRQQVSPRHRALPCPPGQMRHQRSWDRPSSVFNHPTAR